MAVVGEAGPEAVIPLDTSGLNMLANLFGLVSSRAAKAPTGEGLVNLAAEQRVDVTLNAYANVTLELDGDVILEKMIEMQERNEMGIGEIKTPTGRGFG